MSVHKLCLIPNFDHFLELKYNNDNNNILLFYISAEVISYHRIASSFQPIRKRALLQAAIGNLTTVDQMDLLPLVLQLACNEATSSFFLLKVNIL